MGFTITAVMHEGCPGCTECVRSAEIHARATGSVGATYQLSGADGVVQHSATVARRKEA